jgi:hypothetical protein
MLDSARFDERFKEHDWRCSKAWLLSPTLFIILCFTLFICGEQSKKNNIAKSSLPGTVVLSCFPSQVASFLLLMSTSPTC